MGPSAARVVVPSGLRGPAAASSVARLAALLGVALLPSPTPAAPQAPGLEVLLRRAGQATLAAHEQLAVTSAKEEHRQALLLDADTTPRTRRTIVSAVVWIPTGDAMVWAFFRNVVSVDGEPVADRGDDRNLLGTPAPR